MSKTLAFVAHAVILRRLKNAEEAKKCKSPDFRAKVRVPHWKTFAS
jgi:hypothetical protein